MLSLGGGKLGGHCSGVRRDQVALRHLQLALLRLDVSTARLQPAQSAIERAALRRQFTQRCGQSAGVCRKRSSRRATEKVGNKLVQGPQHPRACRTEYSRPGKIDLDLLPARRLDEL